MYSTQKILIDSQNPCFDVFKNYLLEGKRIYNQSLYYARNSFTAYSKLKNGKPLNSNEQEVVDFVNSNLPKDKPYKAVSKENGLLHKYLLQHLIYSFGKLSKQEKETTSIEDCKYSPKIYGISNLPAQTKNNLVYEASDNMSIFAKSIKSYKGNKGKFNGVPKLPNYRKPSQWKTIEIPCQSGYIVDKYGKFYYHTKDCDLYIGKQVHNGKLKHSTLSYKYGKIELCLVFDEDLTIAEKEDNNRYIGIDLGVNNFATISNNIGLKPMVIKGNVIKSKNHFYNKKKAKLLSAYEHCQLKSHKVVNDDTYKKNKVKIETKKLNKLSLDRDNYFRDIFHKISKYIVSYCLTNNINTIIVGNNKGIKQNSEMGKVNNQNFVSIPYSKFISILSDKCERYGLNFIEVEESYTSQSSILDLDILPTYNDSQKTSYTFNGKRVKTKEYLSNTYGYIHADVNGASNIIRKYNLSAFDSKDLSYLQYYPLGIFEYDYVSNILM